MAEGGAPPEANADESTEGTETPVFTVDITDITSNVKYKLMGMFMEKEGPVKDIFNWKETPDLGDAWFDHNKELRKYAYYGEKRRKVTAPVRDLFKCCLPFLSGSAELEAAEADIQRTIERHGNRRIEIYNICAAITYLSAAKGVSVDPCHLKSYLNCKKIRNAGMTFKNARKSFNDQIDTKIKILNKSANAFQELIQGTLTFLSEISDHLTEEPAAMDRRSMLVANVQRKLFLKSFLTRARRLDKSYEDFGTSFWDVQIRGSDTNEYLFDFLLTYIPNLCKLNPQPTGPKPTV